MAPSRYIFVLMLPPETSAALQGALVDAGLTQRLGDRMFAVENWHQSLSDRYLAGPGVKELLLRAGARVSAQSFVTTLNRVTGNQAGPRGIHWEFRARGKPGGLQALILAVQAALRVEGVVDEVGHSPHITISYKAPELLASSVPVSPFQWHVSEFCLVEGGGNPYRYKVIQRWPLLSEGKPQPAQLELV